MRDLEANRKPRPVDSGGALGGRALERGDDLQDGGLNWRHLVAGCVGVAVLVAIFAWPVKKTQPTPIIPPGTVTGKKLPALSGSKQAASGPLTATNRPPADVTPAHVKPSAFPETSGHATPKTSRQVVQNKPPSVPTDPIARSPIIQKPIVPALPFNPDDFTLEVLSRKKNIVDGSSFPEDDHELGELALGDIKVLAKFSGEQLPRGRLTLAWSLDGIPLGRRPAQLGQPVEYGAEPTVGTYKVDLLLEKTVIRSFTFRITPAK